MKETFVSGIWDLTFMLHRPLTDNSGRRLLIGWMGMPDAEEEYTNKTIDEGWQHCLTVPRELRVKDGKIFQYPAKELERLRKEKTILFLSPSIYFACSTQTWFSPVFG